MQCLVDDKGDTELVFAIYVDNKRRSYPPRWIPRSQMLSKKWADKLNELMPLKGKAQWHRCVDGSHTPWRYPDDDDDDDDEDEIWVDVLHTLPQPEHEEEASASVLVEEYEAEYGEYNEKDGAGAEEDLEFYEDDQELSQVVDYAEEGEEYLEEGEEYLEGDTEYLEEGVMGYQGHADHDEGATLGADGEVVVYDEQGAVDFEDDDSDTVHGDEDADACADDDGVDATGYVGASGDRDAISSEVDVRRGRVDDAPPSGSVELHSEMSSAGAAEDAL